MKFNKNQSKFNRKWRTHLRVFLKRLLREPAKSQFLDHLTNSGEIQPVFGKDTKLKF